MLRELPDTSFSGIMPRNRHRFSDMQHIIPGQLTLAGKVSTLHSAVFSDLTVHRDRHKLVRLHILELDDLMPFSGKPAPLAWLLRVLFDGRIFPTAHRETYHPEALGAGAANGHPFALHIDFGAGHQLFGYRA
jgi:hypothetical protein